MAANPGLYRELNVPFESIDQFVEAYKAFCEELAELRKKHRMADVYVIVMPTVLDRDGNEGQSLLSYQMGDHRNAVPMLAHALGEEKARAKEFIDGLVASHGVRTQRKLQEALELE